MVGKKLDGFTHAADWYATFCSLAGVDPFDHRAALANLPPVDGLDLWPYLSGAVETSPRKEVFADSQPFGVPTPLHKSLAVAAHLHMHSIQRLMRRSRFS